MTFRKISPDKRLENFIRLSLTDEMIPIVGNQYALLTHQNPDKLTETLIFKNQQYIRKKECKKNIKKLIGKS